MSDVPPVASDVAARGSWTPARTSLHAFLVDRAPLLAPIYAGAVAIVDEASIPGRSYFVWHAIREIRNGLAPALRGETHARYNTDSALGAMVAAWSAEGLPIGGLTQATDAGEPDPTASQPDFMVPGEVADLISRVVGGHLAVGSTNREVMRLALVKLFGVDVPEYIVDVWYSLTDGAHGFAHVANEPGRDDPDFVENFARFEEAMMVITKPAVVSLPEIDKLLADANRR